MLTEHKEVRFVFIGDGPLKSALRSRAESLGVSNTVDFHGTLAHENMLAALRSLSMIVRPSDTEGLPVVALEAMATGIPVIATDVGGTSEVVNDHVTGLLIHPDPSPREIAGPILSLIQDDSERARLGAAARRASEGLDWSRCVSLREDVLLRHARTDDGR